MKKKKGFTLVELVIVIAIVIVLSVISVPIYRSYVDKAKMSEAYALLGTVLSAEKAYYSEYGHFYWFFSGGGAGGSKRTGYIPDLGVDARGNKYFTAFGVNGNSRDVKANFAGFLINPELSTESDGRYFGLALYYDITTGATWEDNVRWSR